MHGGWIIAGLVLAAGLIALLAVAQSRWLQSNTLKKCVVLSVGVHLLLAMLAAVIGSIRPASWGRAEEGRMTMVMVVSDEPVGPIEASTDDAPAAAAEEPEATVERSADPAASAAASDWADPAAEPALPDDEPLPEDTAENSDDSRDASDIVPLLEAAVATAAAGASQGQPAVADVAPSAADGYADRFGHRRAAAAAARGGSQQTEQAVRAGLGWLARAQSADGRWDADRHGGGLERSLQGHHRRGAGSRSDHGVTGLALLAMLGAGNTHRVGEHAESVDHGLRFLLEHQRPDGSLAGDAEFFASLYCHGMATIALAEAAAMSGDASLLPPLRKAIDYTLSMQSPATGGWRYARGDAGDTSQLGWQVMALHAAHAAGIGGLEEAESRARVFLQRVSSGAAGGLAAYRAGERPSVAMTAEALFCRLLLGIDVRHPAVAEAIEVISRQPPDPARPNAYTWYYATLASFHAGGPQWERFNRRMVSAVTSLQRREAGPLDGSWDPDPVWGGHGGRVYSTAMSSLTLEVYYRYRPLCAAEARVATVMDERAPE